MRTERRLQAIASLCVKFHTDGEGGRREGWLWAKCEARAKHTTAKIPYGTVGFGMTPLIFLSESRDLISFNI